MSLKLDWLLKHLKEGQFAKATFADDEWLIIKSEGSIRYWYDDGIREIVPLTYSNINAFYEII